LLPLHSFSRLKTENGVLQISFSIPAPFPPNARAMGPVLYGTALKATPVGYPGWRWAVTCGWHLGAVSAIPWDRVYGVTTFELG
jgi:hypothetical protein